MNRYLYRTTTIFCLLLIAGGVNQVTLAQIKYPYAFDKTVSEPAIFGEGVISGGSFDSHPAFAPDGKTLYFVRSTPNFNFWTILVSQFKNGKWQTPEVAPFSGEYSDADPFITADGKKFFFISKRPVAGKEKTDTDIWMMEKTARGAWSEPQNLGACQQRRGRMVSDARQKWNALFRLGTQRRERRKRPLSLAFYRQQISRAGKLGRNSQHRV
ncbi:MAG: PD40 domain-containing protein [Acidobacteria bacterium]|nr:PD40 domain-containing protein [Acidobacteriota bacterium]